MPGSVLPKLPRSKVTSRPARETAHALQMSLALRKARRNELLPCRSFVRVSTAAVAQGVAGVFRSNIPDRYPISLIADD